MTVYINGIPKSEAELTGDAVVGDVKDGKFFYKDDAEVKLEGTIPTVTLAVDSDTYPEGYHAGDVGGLDAIDADFATANIKKGTVIFGKTGTHVTAITGDAVVGDVKDGVFFYKDDAETKLEGTLALTGDAVVADVKDGKFFYKDDLTTKLEGTMPTVAIALGSDTYPAGYHAGNGGGLDAIDTDFAVGNIKKDVVIFGKTGTAITKTYALGNGVVHSHDAQITDTTSDGSLNKAKEITIGTLSPSPLTIRVSFKMSSVRQAGGQVIGMVYKNGSPFGTERITTTWDTYYPTFQEWQEDLEFAEDDTCELWKEQHYNGITQYWKDFRILGDITDSPATWTDADIVTGSNTL